MLVCLVHVWDCWHSSDTWSLKFLIIAVKVWFVLVIVGKSSAATCCFFTRCSLLSPVILTHSAHTYTFILSFALFFTDTLSKFLNWYFLLFSCFLVKILYLNTLKTPQIQYIYLSRKLCEPNVFPHTTGKLLFIFVPCMHWYNRIE